jgi:hypothetical protein
MIATYGREVVVRVTAEEIAEGVVFEANLRKDLANVYGTGYVDRTFKSLSFSKTVFTESSVPDGKVPTCRLKAK